MASVFDVLNGLNVNEHTEKKVTDGGRTTLTYLSWPWAWAEVKKRYPDAHYEVRKDSLGLPYFSDPRTGIMVYTTVTIDGVTHEMWLPVMDGGNRAMRFEPYTLMTKYGKEVQVAAATMFDVNKTIMRCLTKNLAMFGLGLYIYAGEDLPEEERAQENAEDQRKREMGLESMKKLILDNLSKDPELLRKYEAKYGEGLCNVDLVTAGRIVRNMNGAQAAQSA